MADRVLVRQVLTTVEAPRGTEAWVEDGEYVQGMVAGGYWEIVRRVEARVPRAVRRPRETPAPVVEEVTGGGNDQVQPDGSAGGDEPSGGA